MYQFEEFIRHLSQEFHICCQYGLIIVGILVLLVAFLINRGRCVKGSIKSLSSKKALKADTIIAIGGESKGKGVESNNGEIFDREEVVRNLDSLAGINYPKHPNQLIPLDGMANWCLPRILIFGMPEPKAVGNFGLSKLVKNLLTKTLKSDVKFRSAIRVGQYVSPMLPRPVALYLFQEKDAQLIVKLANANEEVRQKYWIQPLPRTVPELGFSWNVTPASDFWDCTTVIIFDMPATETSSVDLMNINVFFRNTLECEVSIVDARRLRNRMRGSIRVSSVVVTLNSIADVRLVVKQANENQGKRLREHVELGGTVTGVVEFLDRTKMNARWASWFEKLDDSTSN